MGKVIERMTGESYGQVHFKESREGRMEGRKGGRKKEGRKEEEKGGRESGRRKFHVNVAILFPILDT